MRTSQVEGREQSPDTGEEEEEEEEAEEEAERDTAPAGRAAAPAARLAGQSNGAGAACRFFVALRQQLTPTASVLTPEGTANPAAATEPLWPEGLQIQQRLLSHCGQKALQIQQRLLSLCGLKQLLVSHEVPLRPARYLWPILR